MVEIGRRKFRGERTRARRILRGPLEAREPRGNPKNDPELHARDLGGLRVEIGVLGRPSLDTPLALTPDTPIPKPPLQPDTPVPKARPPQPQGPPPAPVAPAAPPPPPPPPAAPAAQPPPANNPAPAAAPPPPPPPPAQQGGSPAPASNNAEPLNVPAGAAAAVDSAPTSAAGNGSPGPPPTPIPLTTISENGVVSTVFSTPTVGPGGSAPTQTGDGSGAPGGGGPSIDEDTAPGGGSGDNQGQTAGIVAGIVGALVVAFIVVFLIIRRRRKKRRQIREKEGFSSARSSWLSRPPRRFQLVGGQMAQVTEGGGDGLSEEDSEDLLEAPSRPTTAGPVSGRSTPKSVPLPVTYPEPVQAAYFQPSNAASVDSIGVAQTTPHEQPQ